MIDLSDTTMLISVDGNPFDLDLNSTPVNQLARVMCTGPEGTLACARCRGVALRLLLIGDVRIEARKPTHHASLVSGIVECSCGWSSNHHAMGSDAIEQWEQHRIEARS